MNDAAVDEIQTKIAFLERANVEMGEQLFRQQREIQALEFRLRELAERLQALQSEERARTPDEERPPHY